MIFCEDNKRFWIGVRRFLIWLLRELDQAYGWDTFNDRKRINYD